MKKRKWKADSLLPKPGAGVGTVVVTVPLRVLVADCLESEDVEGQYVNKDCAYYHNGDYGRWYMCRNNIPDDFFVKHPGLKFQVYPNVHHMTRKWFKDSSDED